VFHPLIWLLDGDAPDPGGNGWKAARARVAGWLRAGVHEAAPVVKKAAATTVTGAKKAGRWATTTVRNIRGGEADTESSEATSTEPAGQDAFDEDETP